MVDAEKIKQFIAFLHSQKQYSPHTQKAYLADLQKFKNFLHTESINDWQQVGQTQLNSFVMHLHHGGMSAKSIHRSVAAIRGFFKFLLQQDVGQLKLPKAKQQLPKVLSYEQFQLMAKPHSNDWRELRDVAMIELLYSCALRVSELVGLNREQIDTGFLTVLGKGNKMRHVPIGAESYQALMRYLHQSVHNGNIVFINQKQQRLSTRWVQMMVKKRAADAGIQFDVHPHMLRHAAASHFLQSSRDLRTVQDYLGHANISSTQVYTHLDFQSLAAVYDHCHPRAKA